MNYVMQDKTCAKQTKCVMNFSYPSGSPVVVILSNVIFVTILWVVMSVRNGPEKEIMINIIKAVLVICFAFISLST